MQLVYMSNKKCKNDIFISTPALFNSFTMFKSIPQNSIDYNLKVREEN